MTIVSLTKRQSGAGGRSAHLLVPKDIADAVAAAGIESFEVELTEEGILFRPASQSASLPTWLTPTAPSAPTPLPRRRTSAR